MKHRICNFLSIFLLFLPFALPAQGWLELPASVHPKLPEPRIVSTQYMRHDGGIVRSHTYRYDTGLRISLWVAYPLNKGLIGEGSRGDGWHPYVGIPEHLQASLYKGFRYGSGFDRGHQIPSADRLDPEINYETFTFVNATPQKHDFNGGVWADLEKLVRTWAKRSDTLYVVTGCVPGSESIKDNDGKDVNIPGAYYKTVLRRNTDRKGNLRWSMCAVFIPHDTESKPDWTVPQRNGYLRSFGIPVGQLEKVTGEVFFPNLERIVGKKALDDMKAADPQEETWWWK
ncbi:MAG: DNA/RNA non-specific endonuclease [Candidatus Methanomethylophilaceae archaeon]|nr:DNA/RNA non-specific endonuclease [Candidatus Methanomethylophilaceae archaeon]